jgi:hypothetical protein
MHHNDMLDLVVHPFLAFDSVSMDRQPLVCLVLPTRSAMMRFPFLVCMSLPLLSLLPMLLLPHLPTLMMKIPFPVSHTVLFWFRVMVMLRFLSRAPVFFAFPPPPLVHPQPALQAGGRSRCPLGYGSCRFASSSTCLQRNTRSPAPHSKKQIRKCH